MWDSVLLFGVLAGVLALLLANVAQRQRERNEPYGGFALVSYTVLVAYYGFAIVAGLQIQGLLGTPPNLTTGEPAGAQITESVESLALIGWGLALPAVGGALLLLPAVRRQVAHLIPVDPDSPVHAVALSLVSLVVTFFAVTLGVGLGNLATALEDSGAASQSGAQLVLLWVQQLLTALIGMIGVGWLIRRNLRVTLERLGLVRPSWRQVGIGIGLALLLIPFVLLVEFIGSSLGLGVDSDVEKLSEQLLGPLARSPIGIVTVGAAAAIGEETLLRGALLPRFGLLLTTIIFAILHTNYGISISTVVVFALGLVLGIVRLRANTTTAMIVHGVYNSSLAVLIYLGTG